MLGYDKFLPSSNGVDACEGAVKVARKWGYNVKGVEYNKANVVLMKNCFWGRSISACGGSDDPNRYEGFGPYSDGFPLVPFNNVDAIEEYFENDPNVCGIMIEPI